MNKFEQIIYDFTNEGKRNWTGTEGKRERECVVEDQQGEVGIFTFVNEQKRISHSQRWS